MPRSYDLRLGGGTVGGGQALTLNLAESRGLSDQLAMVGGAGGTITNGKQITTANTGPFAYFRSDLGRLQTLSDLTTVGGTHYLSDFTAGGTGGTSASPKVLTGYRFMGDVICDVDYVTLRGCLLDNPTGSYLSGAMHPGYRLEWCTISPATAGDQCMQYQSWSAYRTYMRGCSDGAKINGGSLPITIDECIIRVRAQDSADHNDTLQNVGGTGSVYVRKSNLSVDPEGGGGGPNACFMSADMTPGNLFHGEVTDCYLDGGASAYTLRFYDGGISSSITYVATGNRFKRTASTPLDRGSSNTTPTSQISWSGNVWDDDGSAIALI